VPGAELDCTGDKETAPHVSPLGAVSEVRTITAPIGQAPYSPLPILVGLAVPASDVRLSDEVIDQLVEIGADRVLCALDRPDGGACL